MTTSAAATAAHRFGLGESDLSVTGPDPVRWLLDQIGPADPQTGTGLPTAADGVRIQARYLQRQQAERAASAAATGMDATRSTEQQFAAYYREVTQADLRAHLGVALTTQRPFAERLAMFWANHFTVSLAKPATRALVGAFEREAIRPHIAGSFATLLKSAVTHAAMLRYLDNDRSAGPQSAQARLRARRAPQRADVRERPTGLNENLAREVLELHTLGAASQAYAQADVTAFACVLTGWRILPRPQDLSGLTSETVVAGFDPAWHEPGEKTLLGQRVPPGEAGLDAALQLLVHHPATAQFIATKLARHFVADEPPPALVQRLAENFQRTEGDLRAVCTALVESPQAWAGPPQKLKTPAEFAISALRLLRVAPAALARQPDAGIGTMGQRVQGAPSPAGWSDRQDDWLGPDAVWKRVEWATRVAARLGPQIDARQLARHSLGQRLTEATATQIERAADGTQALALLLLSPEFQRR